MDEGCRRLLASEEIESRLASGRSALEQGDIEEARSALQDVYDASPTHPGLPELAAGIRRIRPRRVPWRAALVLTVVVIVAAVGYALSSRSTGGLRAQRVQGTPSVAEVSSRPAGTADPVEAAAATEPPRRAVTDASMDDAALIRAAIERFAAAYRSRWTPLAFHGCELERELDTATVTCRARATGGVPGDGEAEDMWTFRLQRSASSWKILSVQPSPGPDQS